MVLVGLVWCVSNDLGFDRTSGCLVKFWSCLFWVLLFVGFGFVRPMFENSTACFLVNANAFFCILFF